MKDYQCLNLYGGMDTRLEYRQSGKVTYLDQAKNIDIYGTSLRKARGQTTKLTLPASVLGMSKHEVEGIFGLRAISADGNYYRIDPATGVFTSAKIGLSSTSEPFFFPFGNKLVCLTGKDDPFTDDGTNIEQTTFHAKFASHYGTCGCSYNGRIFIADKKLLAWSAANDPTDWTTEGDAGYKDDFIGDIVRLEVFSSFLLIFTTSDVYYLSGDDNSNFTISHYSNLGLFSRFQLCKFYEKIYAFSMNSNRGLFPIESLNDLAQIRVAVPLSDRVTNDFIDIDKTRINEIIVVPYEDRKQIWVYVPIVNNPTLYKCWVCNFDNYLDKHIYAFYPREGNPITCACDLNGKIYTGTPSGKIYQEDIGNTFDGNIIKAHFMTNPIDMGSSRIKKGKKFKGFFNSYSKNKCIMQFAYDGDNFAPDEEDLNLAEIHDEYFELDEDELDGTKVAAVSDWISEEFIIQNKFTTVQFGIKCEEEDDDFIFAGGTFLKIVETSR